MVRPATIFILFAFLAVEVISFFVNRNIKTFIRNCFLKSIPFAAGYFIAIAIQFSYSHSWTMVRDAGKYWKEGMFRGIDNISDWSLEGFGLSSFALFFICIPALGYLVYTLINKKTRAKSYTGDALQQNNRYIFLISLFYFTGILAFTLLTSRGSLHSFSRFILDSPLFYIAVILVINYLVNMKKKIALLFYAGSLCLLIVFLLSIDYGESKFNFSYTGMYMYILTFLFLIYRERLNFKMQFAVAVALILFTTVWNTYLLNMFLNDAWIFT